MDKPVLAEIVSIGTELLHGQIVDTNAQFLASQLPLSGLELHHITTAGDIQVELCQILKQGIERSNIVLTTGGLGPTQDDLTREAIAEVLDEKMYIDTEQEKILREIFLRQGREMTPSNIKQAALIPSAVALPNPRGTAPGWWVEKNNKIFAVMPGPPREMIPMWQNEIVPRIKKRFQLQTIFSRTIKTFSMPESKVSEFLYPFFAQKNMTTGIYAKSDGIQVRFIAQGDDAEQIIDAAEKQLTPQLGNNVWGKEGDTLDGMVGKLLVNHHLTLATMEDTTGGLLGGILNNSTDSRAFYKGGLITPTEESKTVFGVAKELMNPDTSVGPEMAVAMADAARKILHTDFGLGITAISIGKDQPPTLFIGVVDKNGYKTWQQQHPLGRANNKERAVYAALFYLRERLLELKLAD